MELTEKIYQELLDNLADGVYFLDTERKITYWNHAATLLTGFTSEDVLGKCCADNLLRHLSSSGQPLCHAATCPVAKTLQQGKSQSGHVFLHHKDGHRIPVFVRVNPVYDHSGKVIGAVECFTDTREDMALLNRVKSLENAALFDKATGCAKKPYMDLVLRAWLEEKKTTQWNFGLLLLEIDGLKKLKKLYGEEVGQAILTVVSKTLRHCARGHDLIGYQEETGFFIALIANVGVDALRFAAQTFCHLVAESQITERSLLQVTVSIGGVVADQEDSLERMYERALSAHLMAQRAGGNTAIVGKV